MENNIARGKFNGKKILANSWKYGTFIYIFIVMFIIYCLVNKNMNFKSFTNIFIHAFPTGIIALGMGLVIISGEIDLSVGALWAFSGGIGIITNNAVSAATGNLGLGMFAGFVTIVGVAAACGFINGFMVGKLKIPAFIATLGSLLILRSMCQFILSVLPSNSSGQNIYSIDDYYIGPWYSINQIKVVGIPLVAILFIAIVLIIFYVSKYTKFGRRIYAIGSNSKAASLAGINVAWNKVAIFTLSGALIGFSSFLNVGYNMAIESSSDGNLFELFAIASCVIGGISMAGGKGNIIGILFGSLSYTMIDKIIQNSTKEPLIMDAVKGAILLIAVILQIRLIDKEQVKLWLARMGIVYNPRAEEDLKSRLLKKVNNLKLAYDKKCEKILADKKVDKEDATKLINILLDERDQKIALLNEKYTLLEDNAKMKDLEIKRKLAIKSSKEDAKHQLSTLKATNNQSIKMLAYENKPMLKPVLEAKLEATRAYKEKAIELENAVALMDKDVTILLDNAKHVLDRDGNKEVYDVTVSKINQEAEAIAKQHEDKIIAITAKCDQTIASLQQQLSENVANEAAQAEKHEIVIRQREDKLAKKQAKAAAKKAKVDAKAKVDEERKLANESRRAYIDEIYKARASK